MNKLKPPQLSSRSIGLFVGLGIGIVAILVTLSRATIVIPTGTVGIVERFGRVSQKILEPGIHLINPSSKVVKYSTRLKDIKEVISTTSKEGLSLDLDVSVQYKIDSKKLREIYINLGEDTEEILIPRFRSIIREITAQYELDAVYGEKRQELAQTLGQKLNNDLSSMGFIIDKVLLRKVVLPEEIQNAIQEKLAAEQESQKLDFEIEQARKEAEKEKIEAQGKAEAQRILSQGLTPEVLKLRSIEATTSLAESQNSKLVILGGSDRELLLTLPEE